MTGWSVQAVSLLCLVLVCARIHENPIHLAGYRVTRLASYEPLVLNEPEVPSPPPLARSQRPVKNKALPERKPPVTRKPVIETETAMVAFVVTPQAKVMPERKPSQQEPMAPGLKLDTKMPVIPAAPTSQIVALGTFSHDGPVTAPVAKLAATVQPGTFGGAIAGNGSGHGHGTGAGNPNVVMSSGFGNGAIDALNGTGSHVKVGSHQASNGTNAPVEITFKPKPDYTAEGRKQKINGEVRLEVLFKSDGRIHVVRVLQGLGYGLDEQAVKAAEQIKFKPALREGLPIDSMALVHIIFELVS
ncbi:MAG: energy transducer TonB [Terriglobales bacterium]